MVEPERIAEEGEQSLGVASDSNSSSITTNDSGSVALTKTLKPHGGG